MREIVVVGGGGHAKVIIDVLKRLSEYDVIGYTDVSDRGSILGIPYLGDDQILYKVVRSRGELYAALGIGYLNPSNRRKELAELLLSIGLELPPIISPYARVNDQVNIGKGSIVFDAVVINPDAFIGEYVIINTNSTIEHDIQIGNHVHIGPGAVICGGSVIKDYCFIGAGATVIHNVTICNHSLIGAGSTVIGDIDEPGTYVGNPAGRIK